MKFLRFMLAASLGLSWMAFGSACDRDKKNEGALEASARPVRVVTLAPQAVTLTFEDSAPLEALSDVRITAQVSGTVTQVAKDLGESCLTEELILRIDPQAYRLALEQAKAQFVSAKAAYEFNEAEYNRLLPLYKKGDLSKSAIDKFELQYHQSESEFYRAQAAKEIAEKNLRDTEIRCPFDGVVAERLVDQGQTVGVGTALVNIVDLSAVKLTVGASERDIVSVAPGAPAHVFIDALPDRDFEGTVHLAGKKAIGPARTFPVEVRVPNDEGLLRAGMIARARIEKERRETAIVVPLDAVEFDAEGRTATAFIVKNGKAEQRALTLGPKVDSKVIVERGLEPGAQLVVLGARALSDGTAVRVEGESVN